MSRSSAAGAVAERRDDLQQGLELTRQVAVADDGAGVVEDADVHGPGVQVDAAVESMLAGVEAHGSLRVGWGPDPASWLGGAPSLKIPRGDKAPP